MAKWKYYRPRNRPTTSPEDLPAPHDHRAVERVMYEMFADDDPARAKGQMLAYEAFGEADERLRIEKARQALAAWPDCADAYVILAELTARRKEARALYEQAVAAGERALGEKGFREAEGHFWGMLPTRPYMRARMGLASNLWTLGRRDEAVRHAQDLLRMNPNDNQGVRYILAGWLLALDRDDELARLLDQFPDEGTAAWAYNRVLLGFRKHGDTPEVRNLLQTAFERNPHVPDYLLGQKFPPREPPESYALGEESEAITYVGETLAGWRATAGAIAWLRQIIVKKPPAPEPRGPLGFVKSWLKRKIPQEFDVWQADSRPLASWLTNSGSPIRPWITLVMSRTNDLCLAHVIHEGAPSAKHVWDALTAAMERPVAGEPHRPTELQVPRDDRWSSLKSHLEEIDIRALEVDELDQVDVAFADLSKRLVGKPVPGMLDVPGVQPEQVGRFYDAAAFYFEKAPWRKLGYEAAVQVECHWLSSGPYYGVIIGQSGLTLGLAVYEDLGQLKWMWTERRPDEENARESVAWSVIYG